MENGDIPQDANEHCPGPQSDSAGKSDACEGCPNQQICATAPKGPDPDMAAIAERMATVKHKILVLSGKGGPRKNGLIKQFLKDVYWGELDFLIVDAPPGTSDEHISIVQCLEAANVDGAIIVTTPQQVSLIDVKKEVNFCKKVGVKVLGVVENMSGLAQPISNLKFMKITDNGEMKDVTEWISEYMREKAPEMLNVIACSEVFDSSGGGAMKMCNEMDVPFLGKVPLDPQLCKAAEEGRSCFADKDCVVSAAALQKIIVELMETSGLSMTVSNGV
ncbi:hypothetical protein TSUD_391550 [Trifolium subterraneum]|uniref:Cytosolic Fe-S cluster assembly factor NBP35 n=2 Tax=Trifolium TaxID=3898 RepID=A0A2Z6MZH7_TRISU|nr:hypothetical protein TSUD_391550 [Trifolium subterraneum]